MSDNLSAILGPLPPPSVPLEFSVSPVLVYATLFIIALGGIVLVTGIIIWGRKRAKRQDKHL